MVYSKLLMEIRYTIIHHLVDSFMIGQELIVAEFETDEIINNQATSQSKRKPKDVDEREYFIPFQVANGYQ